MLITGTNCVITKANFCFNAGFDVLSFTSGNKNVLTEYKEKRSIQDIGPFTEELGPQGFCLRKPEGTKGIIENTGQPAPSGKLLTQA